MIHEEVHRSNEFLGNLQRQRNFWHRQITGTTEAAHENELRLAKA